MEVPQKIKNRTIIWSSRSTPEHLSAENKNFNSKISGSIVEYELAEEETVPYTEEQREAYNKIKELYSYKGTTHITCENEVSCIFQTGYYKDLETILNNMQAQILAE